MDTPLKVSVLVMAIFIAALFIVSPLMAPAAIAAVIVVGLLVLSPLGFTFALIYLLAKASGSKKTFAELIFSVPRD